MGNEKRPDFFIDVMGHDINNLNQVVLAYLELLQETDRFDDLQNEYLECAIMATKDCASIVKSVKAVRKLSTESPDALNINLDDLIRDAIAEVPQPAGKKVAITFVPPTPQKGRIVRALPELKLAFSNVIGNSIRHSGQEVNIEITTAEKTARDGRRCFVTAIIDDGHGIPDDIKRTILDSDSTTDAALMSGKGLRLYAVRALAELFGGRAKLEDRVPGDYRKGSRVSIAIPAAEGS
jgi:Signal transduction histidine kinase